MKLNEKVVAAIAMVAHEVNRAYCEALGDHSQPTWERAPTWQTASAINGVNHHLANPNSSPKESHEKWMEEKRATGWSYGPIKDAVAKTHPCFLPYEKLTEQDRAKDYLFRAVIKSMAKTYEGDDE